MLSLSEKISEYYCRLTYADIPPEKLEDMKLLTLDYLGVASKGSDTEAGRIVRRYAAGQKYDAVSTVIGSTAKSIPTLAAFANAISSHSIELDDVDDMALYHHSPPVLSAAFALAEKMDINGKDFLKAAYAGCDMMARVSNAANPSLRNRGFHTTPVCGTFGAAVSAGLILGLNQNKIVNALGLAGAQCSGLMEMYGESLQKRFNPGPAARDGIFAAELADLGFSGTHLIFEGKRGFLNAFADRYDGEKLIEGLGTDFPVHIDFKRYACARPIHNGVDCALNLLKKHPLNYADISKITIYRHPDWAGYHLNYAPKNINETQVSFPYCIAVAFIQKDAFLDQFDEKYINDPEIKALMDKIIIEPDSSLPFGVSCKMVVETCRNETYSAQVDHTKGSKENPMTTAELISKFERLSKSLLSEADRQQVIETVLSLDKINNIKEVIKYFQKEHQPA